MRNLILFLIIIFVCGCSKPKVVLICGDHVCINKTEAEQYFEDNLTLEVKVIDKKDQKNIDLVELNLKSNSKGEKKISILNKDKTREKIKVLSNDEIEIKKAELKKRKKTNNKKTKIKKDNKQVKLERPKKKEKTLDRRKKVKKIVNKPSEKISDICTILEKCSIDEISKYLVKQGKEKKFPDITIRENK